MLGQAGHFTAVCSIHTWEQVVDKWHGRDNNERRAYCENSDRELQAVTTADGWQPDSHLLSIKLPSKTQTLQPFYYSEKKIQRQDYFGKIFVVVDTA